MLLPEKTREKEPALKLHDTAERDADGRQSQNDKRRKVSEEEIKKIIDSLKNNPGIISNDLSVLLISENDTQLILIQTREGQTVRRIPAESFYQLLDSMDLAHGRILNNAA